MDHQCLKYACLIILLHFVSFARADWVLTSWQEQTLDGHHVVLAHNAGSASRVVPMVADEAFRCGVKLEQGSISLRLFEQAANDRYEIQLDRVAGNRVRIVALRYLPGTTDPLRSEHIQANLPPQAWFDLRISLAAIVIKSDAPARSGVGQAATTAVSSLQVAIDGLPHTYITEANPNAVGTLRIEGATGTIAVIDLFEDALDNQTLAVQTTPPPAYELDEAAGVASFPMAEGDGAFSVWRRSLGQPYVAQYVVRRADWGLGRRGQRSRSMRVTEIDPNRVAALLGTRTAYTYRPPSDVGLLADDPASRFGRTRGEPLQPAAMLGSVPAPSATQLASICRIKPYEAALPDAGGVAADPSMPTVVEIYGTGFVDPAMLSRMDSVTVRVHLVRQPIETRDDHELADTHVSGVFPVRWADGNEADVLSAGTQRQQVIELDLGGFEPFATGTGAVQSFRRWMSGWVEVYVEPIASGAAWPHSDETLLSNRGWLKIHDRWQSQRHLVLYTTRFDTDDDDGDDGWQRDMPEQRWGFSLYEAGKENMRSKVTYPTSFRNEPWTNDRDWARFENNYSDRETDYAVRVPLVTKAINEEQWASQDEPFASTLVGITGFEKDNDGWMNTLQTVLTGIGETSKALEVTPKTKIAAKVIQGLLGAAETVIKLANGGGDDYFGAYLFPVLLGPAQLGQTAAQPHTWEPEPIQLDRTQMGDGGSIADHSGWVTVEGRIVDAPQIASISVRIKSLQLIDGYDRPYLLALQSRAAAGYDELDRLEGQAQAVTTPLLSIAPGRPAEFDEPHMPVVFEWEDQGNAARYMPFLYIDTQVHAVAQRKSQLSSNLERASNELEYFFQLFGNPEDAGSDPDQGNRSYELLRLLRVTTTDTGHSDHARVGQTLWFPNEFPQAYDENGSGHCRVELPVLVRSANHTRSVLVTYLVEFERYPSRTGTP